jgi:hypothetical protein
VAPAPVPAPEESIGTATMAADGTITLRLRAGGANGAVGEGQLTYSPAHPNYQQIRKHLGEIAPGRTVPVAPWPDEN